MPRTNKAAAIGRAALLAIAIAGCEAAESERSGMEANAAETQGRAAVQGGELEYTIHGEGEPVLFIHGSHVADAFLPLAREPALSGYRLILYHRRGFAGSVGHDGPFGIVDQAADALAVLRDLGIPRAHVVGHSYGAVTALQLAHDAPEAVVSLSLLEPPLLMVPSAEAVGAAMAPAVEAYASGDPVGAVDGFMERIGGPEWRAAADRTVPGGVEQAERDAATFFEVELPALGEWQFDADAAASIDAPVLYVIGGESGVFAEEGRDLAMRWFPDGEAAVIDGATHLLQVQRPGAVAEVIAAYLARHPLEPR